MASKKPSGLGRGLGALLGDDVMNAGAQGVTTVPIAEVESNSAQPRKYFDEAALVPGVQAFCAMACRLMHA